MNEQNILPWSKDYLLVWSDFKAEPNPAVFEDASSVIKYRCTWTVKSESFGSEIKFAIENIHVFSEFHKHLSWVRHQVATPNLLNHQQGHFDLAELLREEVTKNIENVVENKWYLTRGQNEEQRKQFAREDSAKIIATELEKWQNHLNENQQNYDFQTNYGQIIEKQKEYDKKFNQLRK